ncbi:hypothetical protein PCANC_19413 [Puccinia coronata f. sp. avenae]|uniref:Uncharacterized protein n=1 Tax=Puccinia coronata f. sp. avenae TaxID=200324 RepID=A0A2N5V153_9BASI|nr:hypothetical protein PCASD_20459 [Puccinia coronata f. sp. avenae]PLW43728.1 hypothetical protein PCANC_19413 [Puccinia coronata f. sp. avenae]
MLSHPSTNVYTHPLGLVFLSSGPCSAYQSGLVRLRQRANSLNPVKICDQCRCS